MTARELRAMRPMAAMFYGWNQSTKGVPGQFLYSQLVMGTVSDTWLDELNDDWDEEEYDDELDEIEEVDWDELDEEFRDMVTVNFVYYYN